MLLSIVLQNAPFWVAKRTILECKTGSFRMQNAPFWNAKRAVLEFYINCLGILLVFSIFSECTLSVYHQPLISQSICSSFLSFLYITHDCSQYFIYHNCYYNFFLWNNILAYGFGILTWFINFAKWNVSCGMTRTFIWSKPLKLNRWKETKKFST